MFLKRNLSLMPVQQERLKGIILNNKILFNKMLLTEKEVEKLYRINRRTLQRERVHETGIPFVKLGRRVRYQQAVIDQYIKENTKGAYRYD